jgi:hypothetical protein
MNRRKYFIAAAIALSSLLWVAVAAFISHGATPTERTNHCAPRARFGKDQTEPTMSAAAEAAPLWEPERSTLRTAAVIAVAPGELLAVGERAGVFRSNATQPGRRKPAEPTAGLNS